MPTMPSQLMSPRVHDVGVAVGVLVPVGAIVLVAVGVGVEVGCASYAPMSQAGPCGRGTPRSSVATPMQLLPTTALIAGLRGESAWVRLFRGTGAGGLGGFCMSPRSMGLVFAGKSLGWPRQVVSSLKLLKDPAAIAPEQFVAPVPFETM